MILYVMSALGKGSDAHRKMDPFEKIMLGILELVVLAILGYMGWMVYKAL